MSGIDIRRFRLIRLEDATGISGTGMVAQGVRFSDGTVAIRWTTEHKSTAFYANMKDVELIHGHNGKTLIKWDASDHICFVCGSSTEGGPSGPVGCMACGASADQPHYDEYDTDIARAERGEPKHQASWVKAGTLGKPPSDLPKVVVDPTIPPGEVRMGDVRVVNIKPPSEGD